MNSIIHGIEFLRRFASLSLAQQLGAQELLRTSERDEVTESMEDVDQYDQIVKTRLILAYASGLELVYRARVEAARGRCVDLACGPGHFTLCLARYLCYQSVMGIDLSSHMLDLAGRNAREQKLDAQVYFRPGDVKTLERVDNNQYDLTCFNHAAHHMPDHGTVSHILQEMDRITTRNGLILVMDLVRLRTAIITERYIDMMTGDYVSMGLERLARQFRDSMYAAWTKDELRQAIPTRSRRKWYHLTSSGIPLFQILLGLPEGQDRIFLRSGLPWNDESTLVPKHMHWEWRLLRLLRRCSTAIESSTFASQSSRRASTSY